MKFWSLSCYEPEAQGKPRVYRGFISFCPYAEISEFQDAGFIREKNFGGIIKVRGNIFMVSKQRLFTTRYGCPHRVILCPGREHDIIPFRLMDLNLPEGNEIYGGSAYTDYELEDRLLEEKKIKLILDRKLNSKKPLTFPECKSLKMIRGNIETAFGKLSEMLPRKTQAITQRGFELKVIGFIAAFVATFVC